MMKDGQITKGDKSSKAQNVCQAMFANLATTQTNEKQRLFA